VCGLALARGRAREESALTLDFKALMDPEWIRRAAQERERQAYEQANRDDRTRAALDVLERVGDAGRLTDVEARFVRQATARWRGTGYLTDRQAGWLMGLAERHSLILCTPAGSYVESNATGYVIQSARKGGDSTTVVVPDVDTLLELASSAAWSPHDLGEIRKRWGGAQTRGSVISRFRFGPPAGGSGHGRSGGEADRQGLPLQRNGG
jgi:hypothetical protein